MKIHSCSELQDEAITVSDQNVLNFIATEFKFMKYLGSGRLGHVFLFSRGKDEQITMKVMPCSKASEDEIRTACVLNSVQPLTGIFTHAFGWLSCSTFPPTLVDYIAPEKRPDSMVEHIYLFSEYVPFAWNDPNFRFSDTDFRTMFFLLLHGIYIARREMDFFHHDIYDGNILLREVMASESVHVQTTDVEFRVTGMRFVPKLIDYSESKTKPLSTSSKSRYKFSDLKMLADEFLRKMEEQKDRDARRAFLKFTNSMEFEDACKQDASNSVVVDELLNNAYFAIPEIIRVDRPEKKLKPINRCFVCTTPAPYYFDTTKWNFCSDSCARKMSSISWCVNTLN